MKSIFSRSLFTAFLVVAGYVSSLAQTTVTLPTIPCSNCNGPGAFATTAPACTSGLVGAPLTMSWGAASGATSYTIMIATDANLSQNVATYTLSGTSLSVPAVGLKPSTTYYWTVFANNATGSTKATGGPCTFSTNTTWTGGSATGGFPNGSPSQQLLNDGIAGGYYDCRSGDGTCASGDNLLCNPKFQRITAISKFVPNWEYMLSGSYVLGQYVWANGVTLPDGSANVLTDGTATAIKLGGTAGYTSTSVNQQVFEQNTTSGTVNYRFSFWAYGQSQVFYAGFYDPSPGNLVGNGISVSATLTNNWTQYNLTVPLTAGETATHFGFNTTTGVAYITNAVLCKL